MRPVNLDEYRRKKNLPDSKLSQALALYRKGHSVNHAVYTVGITKDYAESIYDRYKRGVFDGPLMYQEE